LIFSAALRTRVISRSFMILVTNPKLLWASSMNLAIVYASTSPQGIYIQLRLLLFQYSAVDHNS